MQPAKFPVVPGYTIQRILGQGGMGAVYLAERRAADVTQIVALKLIHESSGVRLTSERLKMERRILGRLNHPNIAGLLDAGTAADGTPFLALEYVEGQSLDVWCDARNLSIEARLSLFLELLAGVEHAHRQLVIHRDLKPNNILVTSEGCPKLLDFGIAKLIDPDTIEVNLTRDFGSAFTMGYASPEQMAGKAVGVEADIYALGIMLAELLTGVSPNALPTAGIGTHDVLEALVDRLTVEALARSAEQRSDSASGMRRRLRGDLASIICKATATEALERYRGISEFANDIRLHLDGKPPLFAKTTRRERARKFIRRHPIAVGGSLALLGAIVSVVVLSINFAVRLRAERDLAERARQQAEMVSNYLGSIFDAADPREALGRKISVEDLLAAGAKQYFDLPKSDLAARAQFGYRLSMIHKARGSLPRATEILIDVIETAKLGQMDQNFQLLLQKDLGDLLRMQDQFVKAKQVLQNATAEAQRIQAPQLASLMQNLGLARMESGELEAGSRDLEMAYAIMQKTGQAEDVSAASVLHNLSLAREDQGRLKDAVAFADQALALKRRHLAQESPNVLTGLARVAVLNQRIGNYELAKKQQAEIYAVRQRVLPPTHPDIGASLHELAVANHLLGNYQDSQALFEQRLGAENTLNRPEDALTYNRYGLLLLDVGDYAKAEKYLRASLTLRQAQQPANPISVARALHNLAKLQARMGQIAAARTGFEAAHAVRLRDAGPADTETLWSAFELLRLHTLAGDTLAANQWLSADSELQRAQQTPVAQAEMTLVQAELLMQSKPPDLPAQLLQKQAQCHRALRADHPLCVVLAFQLQRYINHAPSAAQQAVLAQAIFAQHPLRKTRR